MSNDTDARGEGDAGVERAEAAWTEVRQDSVPLLCWDNERGETKSVELSPEAAWNLRREFLNGPGVRHDHSDRRPEDTGSAEQALRETLGDDYE